MTEYEQRKPLGLIVPKEKSKKPERKFGAIEIHNDHRREETKKALALLWKGMGLYENSQFDDQRILKSRELLFDFIKETLLGDEEMNLEQLT